VSNNVNYSFITDSSNESNIVFRSTVNSFGLDHVTDKDITSFYRSFSQNLHFDTGLLPVDGSGILSIRSAGPHTQVAYQHKPGLYYINWGDYEGDRSAVKYYVAQPYRIVIGDFYNNSIYGARTFYSPIPITHPTNPLYHVNLPNINCRGYRGNAVGWICLYHKEDVSSYPFSERLIKLLDRCSGTEAYNDQNMSETDGPRFYRDHDKPSHLWNPQKWQDYSENFGYDWTLDPDLWIPILVQDLDHQDRHYDNGLPLTFVDALLGNAQMYYSDTYIPKPYNQLCRSDMSLSASDVTKWFKQSYNSSLALDSNSDYYQDISSVRESNSLQSSPQFSFEDESYLCPNCGNDFDSNEDFSTVYISETDYSEWCHSCISDYAVYVEHTDSYYHNDHPNIIWSNNLEDYFDITQWSNHTTCQNCSTSYVWRSHTDFVTLPLWYSSYEYVDPTASDFSPQDSQPLFCYECVSNSSENQCYICSIHLPDDQHSSVQHHIIFNPFDKQYNKYCSECYYNKSPYFTIDHGSSIDFSDSTLLTCICGEVHPYHSFLTFPRKNTTFPILINSIFTPNLKNSFQDVVTYFTENNYLSNLFFIDYETPSSVYANLTFCCPTCFDTYSPSNSDEDWTIYHNKLSDLMKYFSQKIDNYISNNKKLDNIYGVSFTLS